MLRDYGFLLESIDGAFSDRDPVIGGVHALTDVDGRMLFQGLGPVGELWVRYPWRGEAVLCRGAVFDYREVVTTTWVSDVDWNEGLTANPPLGRPTWADLFYAGSPGEGSR